MSDLRARLTTLEVELREFLAAGEFQAMAYKLDELAALLREPPADEPRCRCGVPTRVSHFCAVLDHCWVGARAAPPEEKADA